MKDKGYIMLSRKLFSHRIWRAARTFSECEAWIDLIQSARFEATVTIERIGGRDITYGRGQFPASISFLSDRWGWPSLKKVRNFLDMLKKEGMITTDCSQGMNIITLCKYEDYNSVENVPGRLKGKGEGIDIMQEINELKLAVGKLRASQRANEGQGRGKKNKKDNNINNNIPPIIPPLSGDSVADAPDAGDNPLGEMGKTWRDDYKIYLSLVRSAYKAIRDDPELIAKQQTFHPGVDIMLSIEKACTNFWATEAGWKHKKKSRSKEIDMKMTLINAIDKNRVFKNETGQKQTKRYDDGDFLQ